MVATTTRRDGRGAPTCCDVVCCDATRRIAKSLNGGGYFNKLPQSRILMKFYRKYIVRKLNSYSFHLAR